MSHSLLKERHTEKEAFIHEGIQNERDPSQVTQKKYKYTQCSSSKEHIRELKEKETCNPMTQSNEINEWMNAWNHESMSGICL